MKKIGLIALLSLSASFASAKQLVIVCEKGGSPDLAKAASASLAIDLEVANVNAEPVIKSVLVDGISQKARITEKAITKSTAALKLQFGAKLYSSASLSLTDCNDSFSASGTGTLKNYVGGFAGTAEAPLSCTCELK